MNLRCALLLPVILSAVSSSTSLAAEGAWQRFVPFKRVEADPTKSYPITKDDGPWIIMAATFRGDKAEQQAHDLAHELRKNLKVPAYTYKKTYDYTDSVQGRGLNPDGSPKRMKYAQDTRYDEVAVLVGNFDGVDDPKAQKTLNTLKHATPEALAEGRGTSQAFAAIRRLQQKVTGKEGEGKKKGPMGQAFITTNPLLPKEYFAPKGVDKLVLEMNDGVQHSLLKCPGKYTVRIASLSGYVVLDQKKIDSIEKGEEVNSRLEKAAIQANQLCTYLRKRGVEAYEFHDRYESIVTIGSFQSVGTPRADGKTEINPQIHAIMNEYRGRESAQAAQIAGGKTASGVQPRRIAGVTLDIQPMPVEVPKRSISSDYRQTSFAE